MLISRNFIPSLFTILNAFCGFMSIIQASNSDYIGAAFFIIYAMFFDAIDGFVARLLDSSSEFGVELDSLCDVISFGLAPSYLLYSIYFKALDGIGIFVSSLFVAFAAIRLARFNVQLSGFDKDAFNGLPTPMASAAICSYIIFYHNNILSTENSLIIIFILAVGLPLLMISRFRYIAMPKFTKRAIKAKPIVYILIALSLAAVIATKGKASLLLILFYIFTGFYNSIKARIMKKSKNIPGLEPDEDVLDLQDSQSR